MAGGSTAVPAIRLLGRALEDVEATRIAVMARIRQAEERGEVAPIGFPPAAIEGLLTSEHAIRKALERTWRTHPLYPWTRGIRGIGAGTLVARFIAEIGDPLIAQPMEGGRAEDGSWHVVPAGEPFERTLRQLWQYCGVGDPRTKQRRGRTEEENRAGGRPRARMRLYLIVDQFVRHRTPRYREIYDDRKERAVAADMKLGHAENHARRIVAKEFLRDLWLAAREIQRTHDGQPWLGR